MEALDIGIKLVGLFVVPVMGWVWHVDRRMTAQETRADAMLKLSTSVDKMVEKVVAIHTEIQVVSSQHADHRRRLERIENRLDSGRQNTSP